MNAARPADAVLRVPLGLHQEGLEACPALQVAFHQVVHRRVGLQPGGHQGDPSVAVRQEAHPWAAALPARPAARPSLEVRPASLGAHHSPPAGDRSQAAGRRGAGRSQEGGHSRSPGAAPRSRSRLVDHPADEAVACEAGRSPEDLRVAGSRPSSAAARASGGQASAGGRGSGAGGLREGSCPLDRRVCLCLLRILRLDCLDCLLFHLCHSGAAVRHGGHPAHLGGCLHPHHLRRRYCLRHLSAVAAAAAAVAAAAAAADTGIAAALAAPGTSAAPPGVERPHRAASCWWMSAVQGSDRGPAWSVGHPQATWVQALLCKPRPQSS
mmetsp:Transcript_45780/g.116383  ORF Transcript_45780/g.116383 Transcript_45780/m.116383 type:complete len:325 (-) Transcript_45780:230-1204(-)